MSVNGRRSYRVEIVVDVDIDEVDADSFDSWEQIEDELEDRYGWEVYHDSFFNSASVAFVTVESFNVS